LSRRLATRSETYLERDAWRAHVAAFAYGVLGAPAKSYSSSDQGEPGASRGRLGVVTYPSAERCPWLEVGLVYWDDDGDFGVPKEWGVNCAGQVGTTIGYKVKTVSTPSPLGAVLKLQGPQSGHPGDLIA
jgi:hypothetical protein